VPRHVCEISRRRDATITALVSGVVEKPPGPSKVQPFKFRLWFTFRAGVEVNVKVYVLK
jgi:hypothetical protein